ncbi:Prefoldin subunit 3 [Guyanagaster necrorhizus]|uniref:Prefoldin subunit 3 n=1 Tax=Guyanagaster necrorhizus TaxID=856835 RepID=A0A9P8ANP4_9AGAR|nr:Prefoldin subunit 3 [Guyanagaster necrorhizus MCA 3950]KAG7442069.1 Prefoldin subunit 3 [Guyanagaster necrorhizus MCA 3950]
MASGKLQAVVSEERNPRGIPKAPFIADVQEYAGGSDGDIEGPLKAFQDAMAKYRYMDDNLAQRRKGLEEKIPDYKKTLDMVEYLQERREGKGKASQADDIDDDLDNEDDDSSSKPIRTTFELNETLYAEAELEETDTVYLWLGANVMLSYKIPEAVALLKSKLEAAETSLQNTIEDLEFIREQLTIMEVNTARVYNWDVKRRRERREKEVRAGSSGTNAGDSG